ncbi:hypothetical protein CPLU01_13605 [Colletotrichum plurivorum]|uniref:Uncharacterized protein n=1 Tax=Colletotrichum plurivorum TaxID=2175906 RepID=A0A8H6JQ73_9PEZI|nr:hypothetical protein CPLU01_13605 [Colletotrichum plurivorum]
MFSSTLDIPTEASGMTFRDPDRVFSCGGRELTRGRGTLCTWNGMQSATDGKREAGAPSSGSRPNIVPWPVSLEIHEAFAILRKGGFRQPVQDLSLLKPLNPEFNQPFYVFHIGSQFIAVGVDDRKVHNFGVTGQELQQS